MKETLRVLLLQSTLAERKQLQVEYFTRGFGLQPGQVVGFDTTEGSFDASVLDGYDAVVVGGSVQYRVSHEQHDHLDALASVVREAVERDMPLLGVCYGAHVLAYAFGGTVEYMPNRRELGTYPVHVLVPGREDVLFCDFPETFEANIGRTDDVTHLPLLAVPLVNSERVTAHAFKIAGKPAYGVQFHPEYDAAAMKRALDAAYAEGSYFENEEEYRAQCASVTEAPLAASILPKFIERIVLENGV